MIAGSDVEIFGSGCCLKDQGAGIFDLLQRGNDCDEIRVALPKEEPSDRFADDPLDEVQPSAARKREDRMQDCNRRQSRYRHHNRCPGFGAASTPRSLDIACVAIPSRGRASHHAAPPLQAVCGAS